MEKQELKLKDELKDRFVAFIDVLGFSEMVRSNKIDEIQTFYDEIHNTLARLTEDGSSCQFIAISDSVILLTEDNTLKSFLNLVSNIRNIQLLLATKGFWVRGGVATGQACYIKSKNIIFGKAYIEAYNLESEAIFPRVIISPNIVKLLSGNYKKFIYDINGKVEEDGQYHHGYYAEYSKAKPVFDVDCNIRAENKYIHEYFVDIPNRLTKNDAIFISYAHWLIYFSMTISMDYQSSSLKIVIDKIINGLYSEQKHYLKYLWLKDYFLETLAEMRRENVTSFTAPYRNQVAHNFVAEAFRHIELMG